MEQETRRNGLPPSNASCPLFGPRDAVEAGFDALGTDDNAVYTPGGLGIIRAWERKRAPQREEKSEATRAIRSSSETGCVESRARFEGCSE